MENTETIIDQLDGQFDDIDDLDLEAIILKGKDAKLTRIVEYYDVDLEKKVKGRAYIKPISHGDWVDSGKSAQKNKNIDLEELVCAKCWLDKHSLAHDMSKIKEAPKGLVTAVYEEIKYVSGIFKDPFEEKFIERLAKN